MLMSEMRTETWIFNLAMWTLLVTLTEKNDTGDKSKNQKSTLSAFKIKWGGKV